MKKAMSLAASLVLVLAFLTAASAKVDTTFYGYQWLKYDYQVYGSSYGASTKSNNTLSIPRTYLRWKMADDDMGITGNLTVDINNTNSGEASNVTTTGKMIDFAIWVKKGSVEFSKIPFLGEIDAVIRVGQQDTYFGTIDTWQYPLIEKAPEDKNGFLSSADQGIAIDGKIPAGFGTYQLALYNGVGYKQVSSDDYQNIPDKAYNASVLITPIAGLYARASYYRKLTNKFGAVASSYDATGVVAGAASGPIEGFVEYCVRNKKGSYPATVWSGFLAMKVVDAVSVNLRFDTYDPSTHAANDWTNTYIAGLNFKLSDKTSLQLDYQLDQTKGANPETSNNNQLMTQFQWGW